MVVAIFAFVLNCMVRAKQRDRLIACVAFAFIYEEETRFSGKLKRVKLTPKRPTPQEIFALQDYYDTSEPTNWEREMIEYTFKIMQQLGFEVKLLRTKGNGKNKRQEEVDLTKRYIKPAKEVRAEIKRAQKGKNGENKRSSEGDEDNLNDEESGGTAAGSLQGPREAIHAPDEEAKQPQIKKQYKEDFSSIAPQQQAIGAKLKLGFGRKNKTKPNGHHSSDESSDDNLPPEVVSKIQGKSKKNIQESSSDDSLSSSSSSDDDASAYNNKPKGFKNKQFPKKKNPLKQVSTPKRQTKDALAQYYLEYERQQQLHYESLMNSSGKKPLMNDIIKSPIKKNSTLRTSTAGLLLQSPSHAPFASQLKSPGGGGFMITHDVNSPGFSETQTRFSRALQDHHSSNEQLSQTVAEMDMSVMMPLNFQADDASTESKRTNSQSLGKVKKGKKLFQRRRQPGAQALQQQEINTDQAATPEPPQPMVYPSNDDSNYSSFNVQPINIAEDDEEVPQSKKSRVNLTLNMAKVQAIPTVIAEDRAGEDAVTQRVEEGAA
ncbi:hypothetical protein FGO68_gene16539 [Halteria grandinella]|uniref:Uncharacterized protein n=1 Tax=Halteria grandinella TaxID=5974 RepID=A0A8J8NDN2_HALGN|nr:hypothetical protein FGO68_gene16539 [Halteria grandinella]